MHPSIQTFLGVILVVVFAFYFAFFTGTIPTEGQICDQTGQANQPSNENCTTYNIFLVCLWQIGKSLNDFGVAITALSGVAVAAFTFTLWRSTVRLWQSAEATSARQLRAYVHMEIQKGNRIDVTGNRVSYQIALANSGQTPAWHVVTHAAICLAKYPLVDPLPPLETEGEGSKMAIHPNQGPVTSRICVNLTNDQFDLLQPPSDGTGNPSPYRLYLYGKISYKDVFNREWETNFRLSTNGHQVLHAEFLWCAEGNEAT